MTNWKSRSIVRIQRSLDRSSAMLFLIRVLINFISEKARSHVQDDLRIVNAALIIIIDIASENTCTNDII